MCADSSDSISVKDERQQTISTEGGASCAGGDGGGGGIFFGSPLADVCHLAGEGTTGASTEGGKEGEENEAGEEMGPGEGTALLTPTREEVGPIADEKKEEEGDGGVAHEEKALASYKGQLRAAKSARPATMDQRLPAPPTATTGADGRLLQSVAIIICSLAVLLAAAFARISQLELAHASTKASLTAHTQDFRDTLARKKKVLRVCVSLSACSCFERARRCLPTWFSVV